MKWILFSISGLFLFASCQKEDQTQEPAPQGNDVTVSSLDPRVVRTRGAYTPPDLLSQLYQKQIPVHIKSAYPSHRYPYLSTDGKGNVDIWDRDDNSGRQQWLFGAFGSSIRVARGLNNGANRSLAYQQGRFQLLEPTTGGGSPFPVLMGACNIMPLPETDYFQILTTGASSQPGYTIMASKSQTSQQLIQTTKSSVDLPLEKWQISAIGDYEILEVSYDFLTGDTFNALPTTVYRRSLTNNTDIPTERTVELTGTVTNRSKFSETEKLSVSVTSSTQFKVGLPIFADGKMKVDVTTASEWSWARENEQTKTETVVEKFTQVIPPRTTVIASIVGTEYNANITYYAKLKSKLTGQILYVPGRWEGVVVKETDIQVSYPNGEVFRTISLE